MFKQILDHRCKENLLESKKLIPKAVLGSLLSRLAPHRGGSSSTGTWHGAQPLHPPSPGCPLPLLQLLCQAPTSRWQDKLTFGGESSSEPQE